jgi:hypothetical protein
MCAAIHVDGFLHEWSFTRYVESTVLGAAHLRSDVALEVQLRCDDLATNGHSLKRHTNDDFVSK